MPCGSPSNAMVRNRPTRPAQHIRLAEALSAHDPSVRLRAAMAAGTPLGRRRRPAARCWLPGSAARGILSQLAHDDDRSVALVASAFLRSVQERTPARRAGVE